jgi:hypothetical protein
MQMLVLLADQVEEDQRQVEVVVPAPPVKDTAAAVAAVMLAPTIMVAVVVVAPVLVVSTPLVTLVVTAALDFLAILLVLGLPFTQVVAGDIPTVQYPRVTRQVVRAVAVLVETITKVELRSGELLIQAVVVVLDMQAQLGDQA